MEKLGVIDLGVRREVEILSNIEYRMVVAGTGDDPSWDCMFNSFIHYYKETTGITLDKNSLVTEYTYRTGQCPPCDGGAKVSNFMDFVSHYYNVNATDSYEYESSAPGQSLVAVPSDKGGIVHFVNLVSMTSSPIEDGNIYTMHCWDATIGKFVDYTLTDVGGFINTDIQGYINLEFLPKSSNNGYGYNGYGYGYGYDSNGYGYNGCGYGYDGYGYGY